MKDRVTFRPGTILCGSCDFFGAEDCYYRSLEPTTDKWACAHHPYIRRALGLDLAQILEWIDQKRLAPQKPAQKVPMGTRTVASVILAARDMKMPKKW